MTVTGGDPFVVNGDANSGGSVTDLDASTGALVQVVSDHAMASRTRVRSLSAVGGVRGQRVR